MQEVLLIPTLSRLSAHRLDDLHRRRFGKSRNRIVRQMRVACRCLRLVMTQHFADHRQRASGRHGDTGECVPQIVNAHVVKLSLRPHIRPRLEQINDGRAGPVADDDEEVAFEARDCSQNLDRRIIEGDSFLPGLGVRQDQNPPLLVDVGPFQRQDFIETRAGQDQQPQRRCRIEADLPLGFSFTERSAEPRQLFAREIALALGLLVLLDLETRIAAIGSQPILF